MSDVKRRRPGQHPAPDSAGAAGTVGKRTPRGKGPLGQRYQALLDMAPDAMVTMDNQGRMRLVNSHTEMLFGYARADLVGQPVERLIPEYFHLAQQPQSQACTAAPSPYPVDIGLSLVGRHRDGRTFPVEVSMAPLPDVGEAGQVIASIRNVGKVLRVEAINREFQLMQALTDTALAHLELDELLPSLLARVRDVMAVDNVVMRLLAADGQELQVVAAHGPDAAIATDLPVPVSEGFSGYIATSRQPLIVDDLPAFLAASPAIDPRLYAQLQSALGVPLVVGERVLGVLHVSTREPHHFTAQDLQLLQRAAERVALAVERAQLYEAERAARQEAEGERIRWLTAMESAPEFVITCDAALRRTYVNPAYERLRGGPADPSIPEEELASRYGLFLPDGQTLFPADQLPLHRAVREGQPVRGVEMVLRAPDGQERLVVWESAPMNSATGELLGAISIGHDITERRQLEREREAARVEAERQAEQLNRIIEAMADGVTVWDATGRLVRTNAALRRMTALDAAPSDYLQLPAQERITLYAPRDARGQLLAAEDWPVTRALRGEVLTGANTADLHMGTFDGREVVFTASAAPLRDQDGHIVGAVGILRDQTERKRLERAFAEQAEQLNRIFEAMADAVMVYDAQGRTVRTNAAAQQLLGLHAAPPGYYDLRAGERVGLYHKRDTYGRPLAPQDSPSSRALRGEVLTGSNALDIQLRTLDGREVEVNSSAAPLRDQEGHIVGAVGIMRDQTERHQLEREREQAEARELAAHDVAQQLDQFLAVASHDIRTPVTTLSGNLELARLFATRLAGTLEAHDTPAGHVAQQLATVLKRADESSMRLSRLVALLFDTTGARLGTLTVTLAPCDLAALVREQVAALQATASDRTINMDLPSAAVVVEADADRLGQVLTNYLTNALKYSAADQRVAVRVEVRGGRAIVSVQDHGPGLPGEEQRRVWELYYRAPGVVVQSTVGAASGSFGMGLFVCKRLVELHPGGRVGVDSIAGGGSTFWFSLPAEPAKM